MMMKGDVLSGFETLKVCTDTIIKAKKLLISLQHRARKCNSCQDFKGWKQDLQV
jgi:adenylosuccinate synthase